MLPLLAALTLLLAASDHWTTYLCLRQELPGFEVTEGNPLAAWLFRRVGLVEGLFVDSALTVASLMLLLATRRVPQLVKVVFLTVVILGTAGAVANNLGVLAQIGLSPLGGALPS